MTHRGFIAVIFLIGVIFLFGLGFIYFSNSKNSKNNIQTAPVSNDGEKTAAQFPVQEKTGDSLLFDHGDFSFQYPDLLQMYQKGEGELFWNDKPLPESWGKPSMFLRWSSTPLPPITKGDDLELNKTSFPNTDPKKIKVTDIEQEQIPLGTKQTVFYSLRCGVDCYYHIVRFQTAPNKYYELVSDNAGSGRRLRFEQILSSFKFYRTNDKKTFTSKKGNFSLQYSSNIELYEGVFFSVDGVRGYAPEMVTFGPTGTSISFKRLDKVMTVEDYVKENVQCDTIYETETGTVNGEKAILQRTPCGLVGSDDIYFIHKGIFYQFSNYLGNAAVDFSDPIISTFKFTD